MKPTVPKTTAPMTQVAAATTTPPPPPTTTPTAAATTTTATSAFLDFDAGAHQLIFVYGQH